MCITLCDEFASRSFFLRCSKILTSMSAWWWNLFLFLQGQWKCALLKRGRAFMEYASPEGKRKKINAGCVRYYPRIIVGVFSFSRIIARGESSRDDDRTVSAYLMILMAMCCPVLWSSARITWPKLPLPITSSISYLITESIVGVFINTIKEHMSQVGVERLCWSIEILVD